MTSHEEEVRSPMVEVHNSPGFHPMTARTLLLLVGWAAHPAQMWILMTVQAGLRSEAKLRHLGGIRNSSA